MRNARKWPLCNLRTTQAQISLRISAGWSGSSLSAYRINGYCRICRATENAQIGLHWCARWSGPKLFVHQRILCLFCFCVLVWNIYPKIKFTAQKSSDLCRFCDQMCLELKLNRGLSAFWSEIVSLKLNLRPRNRLIYAGSVIKCVWSWNWTEEYLRFGLKYLALNFTAQKSSDLWRFCDQMCLELKTDMRVIILPTNNPFLLGGRFFLNSVDRSTSNYKYVWLVFNITIFCRNSWF